LSGQETIPTDTLEYARSKAYAKQFNEADSLLILFTANKNDLNAMRFHAQVLYWMKEFGRAEEVYEKILVAFPDAAIVKLDYGRFLFEVNKRGKAEEFLRNYLIGDSLNAEANIILGYIEWWKGNSAAAKKRMTRLLEIYPENKQIADLMSEVSYESSPYIKAGIQYLSDDQPINNTGYEIEAGWHRSWIFSPRLNLKINQFQFNNVNDHSLWFQVGDKITVGNSGMTLQIAGGIFQPTGTDSTEYTGSILLTQKISPVFFLDLGYEKKPYQYTIASIKNPLLENFYTVALRLDRSGKWLGKAAYEGQNFDNGGNIQTVYAWLLFPLVSKKSFDLKAGYAFSYSNADKNTYIPSKPMSVIIASTSLYGQVSGVYDPYFSPNRQFINSLLASVTIKFSEQVQFSARTSIGVYARADNPYIYLDKNPGNAFFINKVYSTEQYTPVQFVSELQVNSNRRFSLNVSYTYDKLLFYSSNLLALGMKYHFNNDKRK
jgi:tetratricopeptide (TPR) repeat protein